MQLEETGTVGECSGHVTPFKLFGFGALFSYGVLHACNVDMLYFNCGWGYAERSLKVSAGVRCCSSAVQQPMLREPASAGGTSDRIGRALASMRKAFNEGVAGGGLRGGARGGAAGGGLRGKRLSEPKQPALPVGSDILEGLEGEEDDEEDDDDEGDEELDDDLDDGDDDDDTEDDAGYADEDYDPIAPRGPLENNNYGEVWLPIQSRPRRNRKNHATRRLVQESLVKPSSLIYPLFVHDEVSVWFSSKGLGNGLSLLDTKYLAYMPCHNSQVFWSRLCVRCGLFAPLTGAQRTNPFDARAPAAESCRRAKGSRGGPPLRCERFYAVP